MTMGVSMAIVALCVGCVMLIQVLKEYLLICDCINVNNVAINPNTFCGIL
jgi:hypothetical protein